MIGVYIFIGGGIGSFLRYITTGFITRNLGVNFPYGTLAVNIIGSFLMGALIEYLVKTMPHSAEFRSFIVVGVLGGFTTFSAFSLDAITLFERGNMPLALFYVLTSVICSILAVFVGLMVVRAL